MIIRWVRNLEQAAKDREAAQQSLDGEKLTPAEAKRTEEKITKANREIERYAQRINEDLRRAAEKRVPVRYPHHLDSIHDRQLKDYVASVKTTISRLNYQLQVDGRSQGIYARQLEARRKEAVQVQAASAKNRTTLQREDQKIARRLKESQKRLDGRRDDLAKLERRIGQIDAERKKFDTESQRVEELANKKKLELQQSESELKTLDSQRKNEPNRDRRDKIIAEINRLQPQVDKLREYVDKSLRSQLEQLGAVRQKIQAESGEIRRAADQARNDVEVLKQEIADLERARREMKKNLLQEEDRMAKLDESMRELKRTQAYAKKYGVTA